ncbi:stage II sporulation protein R [Bacillus sp. Marseille-P3661]|uniref:stage II sporulation protein R n=1 Tax=Bacillus sp. Marseille-P3661 TaxID=1936234 RepID=UPI000C84DE26|nr:stage II sporulation protein R [Bacillus sp. Marseille-P3661]
MMKTHAIIFMTLLIIGANLIQFYDRAIVEAGGPVVIPDEAIRLRILANSDSPADQELKRDIRDAVNAEITTWVEELTSIEDARDLIESRISEVEEIASEHLEQAGINQEVNVQFNRNVSFPTKIYGNFIYPAGEYEAILITLGEGQGANWWCVLFPPLCFLDFSNGDAVLDHDEEEEKQDDSEKSSKEEKEKSKTTDKEYTAVETSAEKVEVKSFLVEFFKKLIG